VLDTPPPHTGGGNEERRADGALSNAAEAGATVAHVVALLQAGVSADDVAIISPYAAQVPESIDI